MKANGRTAITDRLALVERLRAVEDRADEWRPLVDDLERQRARARQPAVVTLVGATGAGKSTLLNALVGRELAPTGVERPTTRVPVVYAPEGARLGALLDELPAVAPRIERYAPPEGAAGDGAHAPWSGQVFVDAPDTNSVAAEHRAVVRALAERSDVLVFVAHRQSLVEEASASFLDEFAGRRGLVFVLNRADELIDEARDALLGQLAEVARDRLGVADPVVIATSALEARRDPSVAGWPRLVAELESLAREGVLARVRERNEAGTTGRLARIFADARDECAAELERLPAEVERGLAELASRLADELSRRLTLRDADLVELLASETARRWDGPGGWALRAGGFGSFGLGAGALLARRNPLLAAGTAAGALAAGRVRSAVRDRRVHSAAPLLPTEDEIERWYHEALSEARVLAGRLCGSPEDVGVPAAREVAEQAARAVETSWTRLVDRDLPEVAERAAPAPLRWVTDAPVYAFGGWIVWRAAFGFFEGTYVGLDFLVNALLLLAAWLFVARFALRRLCGRRSRSLLASVGTDLAAAMHEAARAGVAAVSRSAGPRRRALAELSDPSVLLD